MINIDDLSTELSKEIALENLEKKLPPKLLYRFRKWMRRMRPRAGTVMPTEKFEQLVSSQFSEIEEVSNLAKNEAMASFYDNGIVKMDFGAEVNPKVREAALKWAKKKGLNAIEASLNKSSDKPSSFVFSSVEEFSEFGSCVKRLRWQTS